MIVEAMRHVPHGPTIKGRADLRLGFRMNITYSLKAGSHRIPKPFGSYSLSFPKTECVSTLIPETELCAINRDKEPLSIEKILRSSLLAITMAKASFLE